MVITWRFTLLVPLAILLGLQLFQPDKSNPEVTGEITAPPQMKYLLREKCFDCHSNGTEWPWYSEISPVSWWLNYHVEEGRNHLNFSEWNSYDRQRQTELLKDILRETENGSMPPWHYMLLHPRVSLELEDRALIRSWVKNATGAGTNEMGR
jgi:Haem-binding domain